VVHHLNVYKKEVLDLARSCDRRSKSAAGDGRIGGSACGYGLGAGRGAVGDVGGDVIASTIGEVVLPRR
jgi:hypothetical protein